jgi:hypothetical protein
MPHYCSDCEYQYGNEVTAEAIAAGRVSCPVCGSTHISARALAGTAEVVVTAPSPRVATHSHYPDGTEEIAVGGEGFRSSSIAGGNHQRQDFYGRPAQNEEDVLQVCRSLRAALQREGRCGPASHCHPRTQMTLMRWLRTTLERCFESR